MTQAPQIYDGAHDEMRDATQIDIDHLQLVNGCLGLTREIMQLLFQKAGPDQGAVWLKRWHDKLKAVAELLRGAP